MVELFAELFSFCNDRIFAAADFQLVAVGIFKEESVVTRAIFGAHFRAFQISAANFTYEFGDAVNFVARVGPESNARPIRLMMSIFGEAKEIRGLIFSS